MSRGRARPIDPARFIRDNLRLAPLPGFPGLVYHAPNPGSGLGRLADETGASPYWAWLWSGGLALAYHIAAHSRLVAGRRVLDYGAGSGLVAMVAATAGASDVLAYDTDPFARAAATLNTEANGLAVTILDDLPLPSAVDLVLAGDVFYDPIPAATSIANLDTFLAADVEVLVGDPGRRDLPLHRLEPLAHYVVPEFGGAPNTTVGAAVYRYRHQPCDAASG